MGAISVTDFERYFRELYKPLCLFALRFTGSMDDAEDVVQQAFADVWDKRSIGVSIGNFKSYMYRAVHNRSLNKVSKVSQEIPTDDFPEMEDRSDEEKIWTSERDARLWDAIDQLPTERKKVFLMAKRDGLKYQEIADELSISVKTVENQMGKALKALRETAVKIYTFFFGLS